MSYINVEETRFWKIIRLLNWSRMGDDEAVIVPAVRALAERSDNHIYSFAEVLAKLLYDIDGVEWAKNMSAKPFITEYPYCAPIDFLYARCCVVAHGKKFYKRVKRNPADMPKDFHFEALLTIPRQAWKLKHINEENFREFQYITKYNYATFSNQRLWMERTPAEAE